ncbi:MAG: gliding motility-associated C-terminal domain-containing protein, partial [Salibacteraceae bacterium]|nr:gliding motility-associated C-terminal domain-containing protein [Salibacteraceae bacterium]
ATGKQIDPNTIVKHHAFQLIFEGANPNPIISEAEPQTNYVNYILGNDPTKWKSNIFPVSRVIYKDLYDGIDLHVIDLGENLKYEFYVAPFADPNQIKITTKGLDGLKLQGDGSLVLKTSILDLIELKPKVFQTTKNRTINIDGAFSVSDNSIGYELGSYDSSKTLVIDPELIFSTYSGSGSDNWGLSATPDNNGFLISGSIAFGSNYPVTSGAFDQTFNQGSFDACITKFDTTGAFLIYSTYLGGNSGDLPQSLITDADNNTYIFGATGSNNFPMLANSYDKTFNGGNTVGFNGLSFNNGTDIYVVALNSSGTSLVAATYLGGSDNDGVNTSNQLSYNYADQSRGEINLDEAGNVYIASTTRSSNFPVSAGAFRTSNAGQQDGVVTKLNASLTQIIFSTYLGGSSNDAAYGVDVAKDGTVYVAGGTASNNFPVVSGAYRTSYGGNVDGFISRLSSNGQTLLNGTFIGTSSYDQIYLLQLSEEDNPHYLGQTEHPGSQLIFNAAYNNIGGGQIVGNMNKTLSAPVWMTQFGSQPGRPNISPTAFLVDVCNSVYIAGWGGALNGGGNGNPGSVSGLVTTANAFKQNADNSGDFYLAVITSDANTLVYGSYYGGNSSGEHVDGGTSRFDRSGKVYQSVCAGCGGRDDFPIFPNPGAWSATNGSSNCNIGVFKIDFDLPIILADFKIPDFGCAPFTVSIPNRSKRQSNTSYFWDFGNGETSTTTNPSITYVNSGEYTITLVVSDPTSCNLTDTLRREISIKKDTAYRIGDIDTCIGAPVVLGPSIDSFSLGNGSTFWIPANLVSNSLSLNPTASLTSDQTFRLIIDYGNCQEVITQQVNVDDYPISTSGDTLICSDFVPFSIIGTAFGADVTYEWSTDPEYNNIIDFDSVLEINNLDQALNYFYLRTTKTTGCQMMDTVLVTISNFDIRLTNDTAICQGEEFVIRANSKNPKNTFDYFWTNEPLSSNPNATLLTDTTENFLSVNLNSDSSFYLFARSNKVLDCFAEDSVRILVSKLRRSDVVASASTDSVLISQLVELNGVPGDPYNHRWIGPYITDPSLQNTASRPKDQTNTYVYIVGDPTIPECQFNDTVQVYGYNILCEETELFVPDAFTPNGDGNNDRFIVKGLNLSEAQIMVYNRWGNQVFEGNTKTGGWDGKVDGMVQEQGVYNYYIKATCTNLKTVEFKGNVTLLEPK